jgi:asparagine synthase (glutamine-hydrolysing)
VCGFAGIFEGVSSDASQLRMMIQACRDRLAHRGPDDADSWIDAEAGIALGHRRLSIIDLSAAGRQPMISACRRFVLVYNGEIYNHLELRHNLEAKGEEFRGRSDTEVMLVGVARWGLAETLRRANGMFAGALWDSRLRALCLFRDRFGQKPLYYGWAGRALVFGSELSALMACPDLDRTLDRTSLGLFLRHGYVPAPGTIYRRVRKLPQGTWMTVTANDVAKTVEPMPVTYWSAVDAASSALTDPVDGDEERAADTLEALLRDAVRLCMVADVPLGAFLSGGVDSSTVVALMQAQSDRPVRTFSIGFREEQYDEARYAAAVARHLGTEHTELYITQADAQAVIPRLPDLYSEPFADASQIPTYLVSKLARHQVTVALSGDGGDELFGGYNRYLFGGRLMPILARVPRGLRREAAKAVLAVPVAAWDTAAKVVRRCLPAQFHVAQAGERGHKLATIIHAADDAEIYLRLTSIWQEPRLLMNGTPVESPAVIALRSAPNADFVLRMMCADSITYLPDDILAKVDRASMAVGLEARIPLLDHRVYEFAWRLPLPWKLQNGQGKRLLRRVLYRYVPKALIERPKMGFSVPVGDWLRGDLRDWAEALLAEDRLHDDFDPAPIRRCWAEHLSGQRNWQYQLWAVLMFQAWRERWQRAACPN